MDLDLLLEDLAYTKKRVYELEETQEKLIKFLKARFPKFDNQLKKLLQDPEEQKRRSRPKNAYSSFGQEEEGLSTEDAIAQCLTAKSVSVDPVLKKVGICWKEVKPEIPASLRG